MRVPLITCPWCGTNYQAFQAACNNCGGSLPLPVERPAGSPKTGIAVPPPPPRDVPRNYAWRILLTDGWAIVGGTFLIIGAVFFVLGIGLTLGIVTALVGLPFAGLGLSFLVGGGGLMIWRYEQARQTVEVLKDGEAVLGEIVGVHQNLHVRVNGRNPWTVAYRYDVQGRTYGGKVTTLSRPDLGQQPGTGVYVLYSATEPEESTTYPNPYGCYGI